MGIKYELKTSGGNPVIPVSNGDFFTDIMNPEFDDGEFYLEFYNSASNAGNRTNAVTPTAGTITVSASPQGNVFLRDVNEVTITASMVAVPDGTYTPPVIAGKAVQGKMTLAGITGASHMRAEFFRRKL